MTYYHYEVIPVSNFVCHKSKVLLISKICQLDWLQNITDIILVPQNYLNIL